MRDLSQLVRRGLSERTRLTPLSAPPIDPPVDPPIDTNVSWDAGLTAALAQADARAQMTAMRSWYYANTGYDAIPFQSTSGTDPRDGTILTQADLTVMPQGMTATNTGGVNPDGSPGGPIYEACYFYGRTFFASDDLIFRHCQFDVPENYGINGSGYTGSPTGDNWLVEYSTFTAFYWDYDLGVNNHPSGPDTVPLRPMFMNTPGTARFNKCADGYATGFDSYAPSNQLWEYNFVDHIVRTTGSHNAGMPIRSQGPFVNFTSRRNMALDGTSGCFTFYIEQDGQVDNILFQENFMDAYHQLGMAYLAYTGLPTGSFTPPTNLRWIDNYWGKSSYPLGGEFGPYVGPNILSFNANNVGGSGNRYIDGSPFPGT